MQDKIFEREHFLKIFSSRMKELLGILAINQRAMSLKLGISHGYISNLVSGKKLPGVDFLYSLHSEYNINLQWLITGDGQPFADNPPNNLKTEYDQALHHLVQVMVECEKLSIEINKLKEIKIIKRLLA